MAADTYKDYVARLTKTQPGAVIATEKEWKKIKQRSPVTGADVWLRNFRPAVKKEIAKQKGSNLGVVADLRDRLKNGPSDNVDQRLKRAGLTDEELTQLGESR